MTRLFKTRTQIIVRNFYDNSLKTFAAIINNRWYEFKNKGKQLFKDSNSTDSRFILV